ncbi:hypothetical protein [Vulcanococcus limneticus]|uniref:hypothetical protein n=1 Tax=Vulcanococcus limneticus TaxID=2170428 RepID=UPI00398BFCB3
MAWYLVFWRHRPTATVVAAPTAAQARRRALARQKRGYGATAAATAPGCNSRLQAPV